MVILNLCVLSIDKAWGGNDTVHRLSCQTINKRGDMCAVTPVLFIGNANDLPRFGQYIVALFEGSDTYSYPVITKWKPIKVQTI